MLQFWLSHRPLQFLSSPSSSYSFSTLPRSRNARISLTPKRLRDRVNTPGIGTSYFILKRKDTARRVKVNRFLLSIDKHLSKGEWKHAWNSLYQRMELPAMGDSKTRFEAYEHAVALFSSYERFREAREIQSSMMDEGFIPSLSLRTRMASVAVLTKGAKEGDLLELLQGPLSDPDFTELALYQLIRFLGDTMGFSPPALDLIVQSWVKLHGQISHRGALSYLVQVHVKRGQLEDAKTWLEHCITQGKTIDAGPFADLITGFLRREHTDALTATIGDMKKAGVAPDLVVFNTIIFGHIKRLHFKDALATYNLLFSSRGDGLTPDKFTFTSMFKMYLKSLKPEFQVYSVMKAKLPPARELYNNLIECHLIQTGGQSALSSNTLTTSVLNLALQLFLRSNDYEAAYTVLQTFRICQVPANAATVRTVLRPLLAKLHTERRKNDAWVRTLLGSGWYANVEANGGLPSLTGPDILQRLWVVGLVGHQVNSHPQFPGLTWQACANDRRVITGKVNTLAPTDLEVLKNIIRKMFFAGAHTMDLDPSIPTAAVWTGRVMECWKEMIPDKGAMQAYFSSGKAGVRLKKLAKGGVDRRKRCDLRYYRGG